MGCLLGWRSEVCLSQQILGGDPEGDVAGIAATSHGSGGARMTRYEKDWDGWCLVPIGVAIAIILVALQLLKGGSL